MWKTVKSVLTVGLGLGVVLGLGSQYSAVSAVLEGFSINTQDKDVTVTLFTDQKVQYDTETQGKQFSIILPDAKLSEEQMNNGLPIVLDNKNRFIGRAVPTADGKVKIILPNLSASEYAVSVRQSQSMPDSRSSLTNGQTPSQPLANTLKPDKYFEAATAGFATPKISTPPRIQSRPSIIASPTRTTSAGSNGIVRLTPAPLKSMDGYKTEDGSSIWNPYVVKSPPVKKVAPSKSPVSTSANAASTEPVASLSVAEAPVVRPQPSVHTSPEVSDPLWYLHSLPASTPAEVELGNLLADTHNNPAQLDAQLAEQAPSEQAAAPRINLFQDLKDAFTSLPKWLLITLALFLAGLGLFAFTGSLVLLKILLGQTQAVLRPSPPAAEPLQPTHAVAATDPGSNRKSPYGSHPNQTRKAVVEDKVTVNAMDYLKHSPSNVSEAVQNAVLVKFPRYGSAARKTVRPRTRTSA